MAEDSKELYTYKVKDKSSETLEHGFESGTFVKITCADDIFGFVSSVTNSMRLNHF
jgi:hypothetical protein